MLDAIDTVLTALWQQDFNALRTPGSAALIYLCVGTLIFLESGFIPAAPFPCDSVVVLSGTLAAVGVIDPLLILSLIIVCAAIGSWMAYLQGRWLNRLPIVQRWVSSVSSEKLQLVDKLLKRHGLVALFSARFVPVVRSLLPLMMGMRVKEAPKFHYFAWLSAVLWTGLLVGLGYVLPSLPEPISKTITMGLMAAPVMTFCIAVIGWLTLKIRSKLKQAV